MATLTKLASGSWRVRVRRKGRYVSETFLRRDGARRWALGAKFRVDRGEPPSVDSSLYVLVRDQTLVRLDRSAG